MPRSPGLLLTPLRALLVVLGYAAALRANGQPQQSVAVLEAAMSRHQRDRDLMVAFAKALTEAGRFEQALNVIDEAIDPTAPDWNALSVKGAALDQTGRNAEARAVYLLANCGWR